ncbi:MAG: hypothetical protein HY366_00890 [Candidatus Aenigmarchaeota archaeon]|nr:hypothetical protein [Candidatus Aenigmarchaeota archaeon]
MESYDVNVPGRHELSLSNYAVLKDTNPRTYASLESVFSDSRLTQLLHCDNETLLADRGMQNVLADRQAATLLLGHERYLSLVQTAFTKTVGKKPWLKAAFNSSATYVTEAEARESERRFLDDVGATPVKRQRTFNVATQSEEGYDDGFDIPSSTGEYFDLLEKEPINPAIAIAATGAIIGNTGYGHPTRTPGVDEPGHRSWAKPLFMAGTFLTAIVGGFVAFKDKFIGGHAPDLSPFGGAADGKEIEVHTLPSSDHWPIIDSHGNEKMIWYTASIASDFYFNGGKSREVNPNGCYNVKLFADMHFDYNSTHHFKITGHSIEGQKYLERDQRTGEIVESVWHSRDSPYYYDAIWVDNVEQLPVDDTTIAIDKKAAVDKNCRSNR